MPVPIRIRLVLTLALAVVPALAAAAPHPEAKPRKDGSSQKHLRHARTEKAAKPRGCVKAPIEVIAGAESLKLSLANCDGGAAPTAIEQLSALARAPGSSRLDPGLIERLEQAVDHFRKGTASARLVLVSGYRPRSTGSYHATGRALDFRIDGVANDALVSFCKTLPDTGCGFYPNSGFVHMDVRDTGTGHVTWTDLARPGEPPHYVSQEPAESALPKLPPREIDAKTEDDKFASKDERAHSM